VGAQRAFSNIAITSALDIASSLYIAGKTALLSRILFSIGYDFSIYSVFFLNIKDEK
jgi:hypothetical protein